MNAPLNTIKALCVAQPAVGGVLDEESNATKLQVLTENAVPSGGFLKRYMSSNKSSL